MSNFKLELNTVLAAIKRGDADFYDNLSEKQKKDVSFYTLPRFLSCPIKCTVKEQEEALLAINEFYNLNYFDIQKNESLLWKLLVLCGKNDNNTSKSKQFRWLGLKKKSDPASKKLKFLQKIYPNSKYDDLETLEKILTPQEFESLVDHHTSMMSEKEITEIYSNLGWKKKK